MNRVFVFGAGGSKDGGGPLLRDFMFQGMFYLCNQDTYGEITFRSFYRVFELVDLLYGTSFIAELDQARKKGSCFVKSAHKLENLSIEDILGFIDLGIAQDTTFGDRVSDWRNYRRAIEDFIFETIQLETDHGDSYRNKADGTIDHRRSLYDMLVDYGLNASDRNSFITFNYDLLLDKAVTINNHGLLGDYSVPFHSVSNFEQYRRLLRNERTAEDVDILKLHGSLNWAVCPQCNAVALAYYRQYKQVSREHCERCGATLSRVLVPPSFKKDFGSYSFLGQVWRKAQEVIGKADELVVIGYSFPEADLEARWLFKKSLCGRARRPRLFVAEPNPKVREKIRSFFLDTVEICTEYEDFKDYCRRIGCYREQNSEENDSMSY